MEHAHVLTIHQTCGSFRILAEDAQLLVDALQASGLQTDALISPDITKESAFAFLSGAQNSGGLVHIVGFGNASGFMLRNGETLTMGSICDALTSTRPDRPPILLVLDVITVTLSVSVPNILSQVEDCGAVMLGITCERLCTGATMTSWLTSSCLLPPDGPVLTLQALYDDLRQMTATCGFFEGPHIHGASHFMGAVIVRNNKCVAATRAFRIAASSTCHVDTTTLSFLESVVDEVVEGDPRHEGYQGSVQVPVSCVSPRSSAGYQRSAHRTTTTAGHVTYEFLTLTQLILFVSVEMAQKDSPMVVSVFRDMVTSLRDYVRIVRRCRTQKRMHNGVTIETTRILPVKAVVSSRHHQPSATLITKTQDPGMEIRRPQAVTRIQRAWRRHTLRVAFANFGQRLTKLSQSQRKVHRAHVETFNNDTPTPLALSNSDALLLVSSIVIACMRALFLGLLPGWISAAMFLPPRSVAFIAAPLALAFLTLTVLQEGLVYVGQRSPQRVKNTMKILGHFNPRGLSHNHITQLSEIDAPARHEFIFSDIPLVATLAGSMLVLLVDMFSLHYACGLMAMGVIGADIVLFACGASRCEPQLRSACVAAATVGFLHVVVSVLRNENAIRALCDFIGMCLMYQGLIQRTHGMLQKQNSVRRVGIMMEQSRDGRWLERFIEMDNKSTTTTTTPKKKRYLAPVLFAIGMFVIIIISLVVVLGLFAPDANCNRPRATCSVGGVAVSEPFAVSPSTPSLRTLCDRDEQDPLRDYFLKCGEGIIGNSSSAQVVVDVTLQSQVYRRWVKNGTWCI